MSRIWLIFSFLDQGPRGPEPRVRQVAVKETTNALPDIGLENEARFIQLLRAVKSDHLIRQTVAPIPNAAGYIQRLVLQYCPMGDLWSLAENFITR
jgi:hypothetical protein